MNRDSVLPRILSAAIFTLSFSYLAFAQEQNRVVDWHAVVPASDARVLEIVDIKVDGKPITIGQPFTANERWLNTLTFTVRNISRKTVSLFAFGVAFPEIDASGRTPMLSIPYNAEATHRDSSTRKPLLPDEEVDLKLPEDRLETVRQISMKLLRTTNLSKVNILPGLVTFTDGSRIGGISLRRPVSGNP
jgi:hypothetical protein